MKRLFFLSAIPLLMACVCSLLGNTPGVHSGNMPAEGNLDDGVAGLECPKRDTTLLDIYFGMVYDMYDQHCVLDSIPGLLKQSYSSVWKDLLQDCPDSCMYEVSFTFYIDKEFPTQQVYKTVAEYFSDCIVGTFQDNLKGGREDNPVKISDYICLDSIATGGLQLIGLADGMFRLANEHMKADPGVAYERILPLKTTDAACRIYEDEDIATYMFSGAFDMNGSVGSTNSSRYVSIDKKSGKVLGFNELVGKENEKTCEALLREAFRKEREQTGRFLPDRVGLLLDDTHRDCCALVKEGILFYYHAYELGSGADGGCNLIIDRF